MKLFLSYKFSDELFVHRVNYCGVPRLFRERFPNGFVWKRVAATRSGVVVFSF